MGSKYSSIPEKQIEFIRKQKIFFTGTAACDGRVNVSPKGMDTFRIVDPNKVIWLNLTGSGNETAAHLLENNRITIMFCSFEGAPLIVRLYGRARAVHPSDSDWNDFIGLFPEIPGSRQIIVVDVDLVQTSCGFGVPYFDYRGERDELEQWALRKGKDGIEKYWKEKNAVSIDGKPTGIKR